MHGHTPFLIVILFVCLKGIFSPGATPQHISREVLEVSETIVREGIAQEDYINQPNNDHYGGQDQSDNAHDPPRFEVTIALIQIRALFVHPYRVCGDGQADDAQNYPKKAIAKTADN